MQMRDFYSTIESELEGVPESYSLERIFDTITEEYMSCRAPKSN